MVHTDDGGDPDRRRSPGRRRVLAALGSATGAALAGCIGSGGEPSYEAGEAGDVDGEGRSAGEMATAEAIAVREPHQGVSPLGTLSVADHEFVLEDGYEGSTVQGTVGNTGDDRIEIAEVRVRVYDDGGAQLGRYFARTGDLAGGDEWAFTVIVLESPADVASYDVAVLGTPT